MKTGPRWSADGFHSRQVDQLVWNCKVRLRQLAYPTSQDSAPLCSESDEGVPHGAVAIECRLQNRDRCLKQ